MRNGVIYEQSWLFLLLIIPIIIFLFWKYLRFKNTVLTFTSINDLDHSHRTTLSPPIIMLILRLMVIFFTILGLANFKSIKSITHKSAIAETDIILALDISKSMSIEDIKPNRLEALKDVLNRFIAGRSHDRIGIVIYAGESLYWCPLTKDYSFLLKKVNQIDEQDLSDGTAIGLGLTSAVNALSQSKNKNRIIILLTDGENNTGFIDPLTSAEVAKRFNIKVYTIGIGHTGLASFPLVDLDGKKSYVPVKVSIDEAMLKTIAVKTGGIYFNASNAKALQTIYAEIDKLEKTKVESLTEISYHAEFRLFILLAIFFLLLEILFKFTLYRTLG